MITFVEVHLQCALLQNGQPGLLLLLLLLLFVPYLVLVEQSCVFTSGSEIDYIRGVF
jgi:hypothetical protein